MTNRNKAILAAASVTIVALVYIFSKKKQADKEKLLDAIADEGYELAHDMLVPLNRGSKRYW